MQGQWPAFLSDISGISPLQENHKRPSEGVWLIELPSDTPVFAAIVYFAESRELSYRVLYFDSLPCEYSFVTPLK